LARGDRRLGGPWFRSFSAEQIPPIVDRLDQELLTRIDRQFRLLMRAKFRQRRLVATNLLHAVFSWFSSCRHCKFLRRHRKAVSTASATTVILAAAQPAEPPD